MQTAAPKPSWNRALMREDQAAKGWNDSDLGRRMRPRVHQSTVSRWFLGKTSNPKLGARIAKALGQEPERYLVRAAEAAAS